MSDNRFDRKAAEWDKKQRRRELASAVAGAISSLPLTTDMTAMDFGCGTGLVCLPLAPQLGRIIALDSSSGMIDVLQQKLQQLNINNVEARCGEITDIDFEIQFDLIFTSMTLHHIEDTNAVLNRFADLVKAGGLLAVADLDAEDGSFHKPGSGEKHHGFSRQQLKEKLAHLNFSDITFQTAHHITRTTTEGNSRDYPVFLATARKL